MKSNLIGSSPRRPDGVAKTCGQALYADDTVLPGMMYAATVRSPHARARVVEVRWQPEKAPEGAVCLTARDLPGPNGVQLLDDSWPILADGEVRYVGEPVALVAAESRADARIAADAVDVFYEPLKPELDLDGARELFSEIVLECGDPESALASAFKVVEGQYRTGHQEHIYIECQGLTAWTEPTGLLVVEGSMQCPYYVQGALVHALEMGPEELSVRPSEVGGGFGGKEDLPSLLAVHVALLTRATGRPVRLSYGRHEDIIGSTKRHPSLIRHKTGVDADGRLLAMDIDVILDGGAYKTLSPVVLSRAVLHATGPYRCSHVRIRGRAVRTNTFPNGAFRGFGAPQAEFAAERQLDRVARALGLDPLTIREKNVVEAGDKLATGQVLDASTAARECLQEAAQRTDFKRRWQAMEEARERGGEGGAHSGIGISLFFHGAGFTGNGERKMRSPVTVRLQADGRIELLTSNTEMGQGQATVFPQIAAAAGGLTLGDVVLALPDTARVPDSGPTVASRTTMVVGGTLAQATSVLVKTVVDLWQTGQGGGGDLEVVEGVIRNGDTELLSFRDAALAVLESHGEQEVTLRHEPPAWQEFDEETYRGSAYPTYGWGADVVEVEVDPDILEVKATKATAVCDVGRVIHPGLCKGQVEGGTLQALGYALWEEIKTENGRYLNDRLATYIVPTAKDSPVIDAVLLEHPWDGGPFGAKGVGELPMSGGAPATLQAIENATGIVVDSLPATPEALLQARQQRRQGS